MLLLSLLELAFGQLFFNHMRASVCVPVWDCSCYLIEAMVITFKLMLLLSLLELALDQLFFNHMRASVCVPVWGCYCYLIEAIVITFKLLSSHASLVYKRSWPKASFTNDKRSASW